MPISGDQTPGAIALARVGCGAVNGSDRAAGAGGGEPLDAGYGRRCGCVRLSEAIAAALVMSL